MQEMLSFI